MMVFYLIRELLIAGKERPPSCHTLEELQESEAAPILFLKCCMELLSTAGDLVGKESSLPTSLVRMGFGWQGSCLFISQILILQKCN